MFPNSYGGIVVPDPEKPVDPMTQPLSPVVPDTWVAREDRARWVLTNFTQGEKAKLARLLQDELRHYDLRALEHKEREALLDAQKAKVQRWP